jgi:hypothetical protein
LGPWPFPCWDLCGGRCFWYTRAHLLCPLALCFGSVESLKWWSVLHIPRAGCRRSILVLVSVCVGSAYFAVTGWIVCLVASTFVGILFGVLPFCFYMHFPAEFGVQRHSKVLRRLEGWDDFPSTSQMCAY